MKIAIAICTMLDPTRQALLLSGLSSVGSQELPECATLEIVLVVNGRGELRFDPPPGVIVVREPRLGIPQARNLALRTMLEAGADLLGFIDDDEVPPKGWLSAMAARLQSRNVDVVLGDVRRVDAIETCCAFAESQAGPVRGIRKARTAATNNVLFKRWLVADAGLTFDERLRFSGGSDGEFFFRAHLRGARILRLKGLAVAEYRAADEDTRQARRARAERVGANFTYRVMKNLPIWRSVPEIGARCVGKTAHFVLVGGAAALLVPVAPGFALKKRERAMLSLAFVLGVGKRLLGADKSVYPVLFPASGHGPAE